jgi:hypothetical protein
VLTTSSYTVEGGWEVTRKKDPGFQKVSGRFEHPLTDKPGAYIESVAVPESLAGAVSLRINGTNVNGRVWRRTSTNDLPARWEVEIASPIWSYEDYITKLPRYLFVTTRNGPERRTPLLWWRDCGSMAQHRRVKQLLSRTTYPYEHYGRLLAIDYVGHDYQFFFGDGDRQNPGADPVCWNTPHPDPAGHTAVSFIPTRGIPDQGLGERTQSGWPFDWGFNPWDKDGGTFLHVFNFYCKHTIAWRPSAPWVVVDLGNEGDYVRYDIEADLRQAGPPEPPAFLEGIRFKRDYIGPELRELAQRQLEAPQYEIRMLTSDDD